LSAAGFNHLILATAAQCHIYDTRNFNTPHIFDLKDTVHLILQCERSFLTVDHFTGIQIYTYEGRHVCNPKFQGTCHVVRGVSAELHQSSHNFCVEGHQPSNKC
jgi:hypothetical protein